MDQGTGPDEKVSVWPMFVALGVAVSEVGVVFGFLPLAVGGILLFEGSVAGIVHEAGYAEHPWRLLAGLGGLFVVAGALVVYTQVGSAVGAALVDPNGVTLRGLAIAGAGAIAVAAGGANTALLGRTESVTS